MAEIAMKRDWFILVYSPMNRLGLLKKELVVGKTAGFPAQYVTHNYPINNKVSDTLYMYIFSQTEFLAWNVVVHLANNLSYCSI
jgi:hypothetical protein